MKKLNYPHVFTVFGFYINSLIDEGKFISIKEMTTLIESRKLWSVLENDKNNYLFMYNTEQKEELSDYLESSVNALDFQRHCLVSKNGYCLLLAFLLCAIQDGEKSGWFPSLNKG